MQVWVARCAKAGVVAGLTAGAVALPAAAQAAVSVPTGTVTVDGPAVPGLPVHASVDVTVPTGRTLTRVEWRAVRADCAVVADEFDPLQAEVTCGAALSTPTTVQAVAFDSSGGRATLTGALTFSSASTPRQVALSFTVDGQTDKVGVCSTFPAQARVEALDVETGLPIRGLGVILTRTVGTTTTYSAARPTTSEGVLQTGASTSVDATLGVVVREQGPYDAAIAPSVETVPADCESHLTAEALQDSTPWAGTPVTISGTLRRELPTFGGDAGIGDAGTGQEATGESFGTDDGLPAEPAPDPGTEPDPALVGEGALGAELSGVPVVGVPVVVTIEDEAGVVTRLGAPVTNTDGVWSTTIKAGLSGKVVATHAARTGFVGTSTEVGDLTVLMPGTDIAAEADSTEVATGTVVRVTGSLVRVTEEELPLPGAVVQVRLTLPSGAVATVAKATVNTLGAFATSFTARTSGELSVVYAGAATQTGSDVDLGDLTVSKWDSEVTLSGSPILAKATRVTGTAFRTFGDTRQALKGTKVALVLYPSDGGSPKTLATATVNAAGSFAASVTPRKAGTVQAVVATTSVLNGGVSEELPV